MVSGARRRVVGFGELHALASVAVPMPGRVETRNWAAILAGLGNLRNLEGHFELEQK